MKKLITVIILAIVMAGCASGILKQKELTEIDQVPQPPTEYQQMFN